MLLQTSGCKSRRGKRRAPRSRLRVGGEILRLERSVESPGGAIRSRVGKQTCGPNAKA